MSQTMTENDRPQDRPFSKRATGGGVLVGLLLMAVGLPLGLLYLFNTVLAIFDPQDLFAGNLTILGGVWLTLGVGFLLTWHAGNSVRGRVSRRFALPSSWVFPLVFVLLLGAGGLVQLTSLAAGVLPLLLVGAASLPPLFAVAWFVEGRYAWLNLTWRRAWLAFLSGGTLGVVGSLVLSFALPGLLVALLSVPRFILLEEAERFIALLSTGEVAQALSSWAFFVSFVQLALVAPLAEEIAKPLFLWPWLKRVSRGQAFVMGALAGAGFAVLENVLYAGGLPAWGGILGLRALGGAIHPLGSGLMALAWRDVLAGEPQAGRLWLLRFGVAGGMHALWNGGSLVVITLTGVNFFGAASPEMDVLGLSVAGTTVALLLVLGGLALWLGRQALRQVRGETAAAMPSPGVVWSNQTVALWAMACLVIIVPAGIAGLRVVLQ